MIASLKYFSTLLLFSLFGSFITYGQEKEVISSEPAYILVQNNMFIIPDNDYKIKLPFTILFPIFNNKRTYVTNISQINLIGKINNTEDVNQLFIDSQSLLFSEDGLFFKIIDLSPGKNVLQIKVVPIIGKSLVVNFFIERTKERF